MKLKIPSTILFLLLAVGLFAQNPALTGKVTDEGGTPIAGVFVSVKGAADAASTVTDADGRFSLAVPKSARTLVFSMLSYETAEVEIGQQTVFNVALKDDALMLNETVVVGYGTMIRKELTSSVASVGSEELTERASAFNLAQSMAGKMAGVQAVSTSGRPGGVMNVTVRGMGSINASNDPLYVVDGVVDVDPVMINAADIEKIDVLKDAAATAIYGAKGSNGVVMITTKAGKAGDGTITFDSKTGVDFLARRLNALDSEQYLDLLKEVYAYNGEYMPHLLTPNEKLFSYQKDAAGAYVRDANGCLIATPLYNTDWQKECFRTGLVTDNTLSFTKGNERSKIYASLGFQNVDGVMKTTYSKKYTGTIRADIKVTDWLDLRASLTAGHDKTNANDNEGTMMNGASRMVYEIAPIFPVAYPDGTPSRYNDYKPGNEPKDNAITQLEGIYNVSENTNVLTNFGLDWHLAPHLTLTTNASYYTKDTKVNYFARNGIFNWSTNENVATVTNQNVVRWTNEDYLTYQNTFLDGAVKSTYVLGASWYSYLFESNVAGANSIPNEDFMYNNLGSGTTLVKPTSGYDKQTMNSFYFRTNQVFLDKYMLGVTLRADGASVFGANHKYGFFPSASAAWAVSEEPWFAPAKQTINQLKLRLSYGLTGNSNIASYQSLATFAAKTQYFAGKAESGQVLAQLANGDLTWESAGQFDAGLDISLFKDRIQVIADFYIKNTYDLLYNLQVPYTTGYESTLANCAQLRNTGFELTINSHNIDNRNFKWDTDFIFSTNKTMTVDLGGNDCIDGGSTYSAVGEEWGRWFVRKRLGVWQIDEAEQAAVYGAKPGDMKYLDVNEDGVYDDNDRVFVGGTQRPKAEFSLVNTFYWNGFTLGIDLGAMVGFKVYSYAQWLTEYSKGDTNHVLGVLKHAWNPENPNTRFPAIIGISNSYQNNASDDYYLNKADYLRIRNISLTYDFKDKLLKNNKFFKGFIFGVNVENAYVFTPYSGGYDPETGWGAGSYGVDWLQYPRPMVITGNLKLSF